MAEEATEEESGPEEVTRDDVGLREGIREGAGEMREDVSREKVEDRLREAIDERPVVKHLLDLRIVARALLIAAVVCLVAWLLLSAKIAAFLLVVVFLGAWAILAMRDYNRRRPTKPADADDDEDE